MLRAFGSRAAYTSPGFSAVPELQAALPMGIGSLEFRSEGPSKHLKLISCDFYRVFV